MDTAEFITKISAGVIKDLRPRMSPRRVRFYFHKSRTTNGRQMVTAEHVKNSHGGKVRVATLYFGLEEVSINEQHLVSLQPLRIGRPREIMQRWGCIKYADPEFASKLLSAM